MCIVVNDRQVVLGLVKASDLSDSGDAPRAADVMHEGPSTYRPNVSAKELAPKLGEKHPPWVLVTTSTGVLVGLSTADKVRDAAY
ncbi:MAG: hypothetical protein QOG03_849 [Actinomycetota bacterium]|nr:hypothetical protein [Actinomycetota bacterium]